MVQGYCVQCKKKGVTLGDAIIPRTAKGGYMAKGKCGTCGTTVCAMMSQANAEAAVTAGEAKNE